MKKTSIIAALTAALLLTGCSGGNSASDKDKFEEYINQFKELTMYDN